MHDEPRTQNESSYPDGNGAKMVVKGLYDIRKKLRDTGDPANDVEDLILRVIHAPERREARRADRDAAR